MTEQEWVECTDPTPMLEFLKGKASGRKFRLFACACCRRALVPLDEERCLQALQVAEDFADGEKGEEELDNARNDVCAVLDMDPNAHDSTSEATWTAYFATSTDCADPAILSQAAGHAAESVAFAAEDTPEETVFAQAWIRDQEDNCRNRENLTPDAYKAYWDHSLREAYRQQCRWLQDLFGTLPFRPVAPEPSWLAWNHGTVVKIAQAIYDDRAFDRMPILADALEEAGCDNLDVLAHCRSDGPHVRGCWVVDLILRKE